MRELTIILLIILCPISALCTGTVAWRAVKKGLEGEALVMAALTLVCAVCDVYLIVKCL